MRMLRRYSCQHGPTFNWRVETRKLTLSYDLIWIFKDLGSKHTFIVHTTAQAENGQLKWQDFIRGTNLVAIAMLLDFISLPTQTPLKLTSSYS